MENVSLPLGCNYNPDNYRAYFADTGLLIGSLDEDVQSDLRENKNFNTYKGAIYEKGTIEMDFFIRDKNSLIPVEVKAGEATHSKSLSAFVNNEFAHYSLRGLRCSMLQYANQQWMENIPLYAVEAFFSKEGLGTE